MVPPRKTILVVDDDTDLREMLTQVLEEEGYDVVSLANGREALDYLRTEAPPSLVLLDLMMPVMDGWQFRAEQCRDEALARVPVLVISAGWIDPVRNELQGAECLRKPIDVDALLRAIRRKAT
jgi:CheY-like chemotaxis protein